MPIARPLLVFSAIVSIGSAEAQNYVPNWSFEEHTECPDYWNEVERAAGWHKSLNNNDPEYHTDYINACGTSNFTIPTNIWGSQTAVTGSAYMAQVSVGPEVMTNYRENIYIQLVAPLEPGQDYEVHFKVSRADHCQHASNNQGVKFSTVPDFPIDGISQVYSDEIITDDSDWTEITGTFTADSAYSYVCVGNFFTDAQTLISTPCSSCSANHFAYYIDDVCVIAKNSINGDCTVAYSPLGVHDGEGPGAGLRIVPSALGVNVQFTRPLIGNATLILLDMEGRTIRTTVAAKGSSVKALSMEGLDPGTYIIRMEMDGQHWAQRFINL